MLAVSNTQHFYIFLNQEAGEVQKQVAAASASKTAVALYDYQAGKHSYLLYFSL